MSVSGILVAESLLKDSPLEGVTLQVDKVSRGDVGDVSAGQPLTWTFIEFNVEDAVLTDLVEALSRSLDPWGHVSARGPIGGSAARLSALGSDECLHCRLAGSASKLVESESRTGF